MDYFLIEQFSPRDASINWDPEMDLPEDLEAFFDKYMQLPLFLRFGLGSETVSNQVFLLAQKMGWEKDKKRSGEISRLVRDIFLHNLRENDLLLRIKERLELTGEIKKSFYQEIKRIAFMVKEEGKKEFSEEYEMLSLFKIINTYPETKKQKIGRTPIYLVDEQIPLIPSVENWMQDYISQMGSKKHTALERSRYLFESSNSKELNSTERKKLAILLKSYDEETPLVFNKTERKIELEESLKIDEERLTSLDFFLKDVAKSETLFASVGVQKNLGGGFVKKKEIKNEKEERLKNVKNVLDLSQLV